MLHVASWCFHHSVRLASLFRSLVSIRIKSLLSAYDGPPPNTSRDVPKAMVEWQRPRLYRPSVMNGGGHMRSALVQAGASSSTFIIHMSFSSSPSVPYCLWLCPPVQPPTRYSTLPMRVSECPNLAQGDGPDVITGLQCQVSWPRDSSHCISTHSNALRASSSANPPNV